MALEATNKLVSQRIRELETRLGKLNPKAVGRFQAAPSKGDLLGLSDQEEAELDMLHDLRRRLNGYEVDFDECELRRCEIEENYRAELRLIHRLQATINWDSLTTVDALSQTTLGENDIVKPNIHYGDLNER